MLKNTRPKKVSSKTSMDSATERIKPANIVLDLQIAPSLEQILSYNDVYLDIPSPDSRSAERLEAEAHAKARKENGDYPEWVDKWHKHFERTSGSFVVKATVKDIGFTK